MKLQHLRQEKGAWRLTLGRKPKLVTRKLVLLSVAGLFLLSSAIYGEERALATLGEPELISIFPLGGQRGSTFEAEVRGKNLDGVSALWFLQPGFRAEIKKIECAVVDAKAANASDLMEPNCSIQAQVEIGQDVETGRHSLRLVSARGMSNSLSIRVSPEAPLVETGRPHSRSWQAQPLNIPVLLNGKISKKGELDYYTFDAQQGQELYFHAVSNIRVNQGNFDAVQLALYEPTGSWFDSQRPTRLAVSDEPRLTYQFSKPGRYLLEVGTHLGIGGPGSYYQLQITHTNEAPPKDEKELTDIDLLRRPFTRELKEGRLQALWARTVSAKQLGTKKTSSSTLDAVDAVERPKETHLPPRSASFSVDEVLTVLSEKEPNDVSSVAMEIVLPVLINGSIDHPGDIDRFRFKVTTGKRLAFELETPESAPPEFNPKVAILDENGKELLNNIYRTVGGDGDDWIKTIQTKVIYTFEREAECTLQIRDFTPRYGNPSFKYRVLIRPQIPHVGKIEVKEDHVNLVPGESRKLTIIVEQEEGFDGQVALVVENLSPGLLAFAAVDVEPDRPAPLAEINKEHFFPRSQKATILLIASADAANTMPQLLRISARPVVGGKLGEPLLVRDIPLMVAKPDIKAVRASAGGSALQQERK